MGLLVLIKEWCRSLRKNEFCALCKKDMGFPWRTTHIDNPIRRKDGASYEIGIGQFCGTCERDTQAEPKPRY